MSRDELIDALKRLSDAADALRFEMETPDDSEGGIRTPNPPIRGAWGGSPSPVGQPSGVCPMHGQPWKLVPAGYSEAKQKSYAAFYACPERGCRERPNR